jgi:hypothetical protein
MDQLRFGVGTLWIVLTIAATAILGTDFILHEIRTILKQRRKASTE